MKKDIFITAISTIAPNILPIAASLYIGYDRGFLSLEFLFVQILLLAGFNWIATIVGTLAITFELIYGISQAYPIFETNQLIDVIQFIPFANKKYIFFIIFVYFQYFLAILLQKKLVRNIKNKKTVLAVVIFIIFLANFPFLNNFEKGGDKFYLFEKQSPFSSIFFDLQDTWRFNGTKSMGIDTSKGFSPWKEASVEKIVWPEGKFPKKILFILVESWGVPKNSEEYSEQVFSIKNNKNFIKLNEGLVKYGGGTVTAELRELCELYPSFLSFKEVPYDQAASCLPNRLKNLGYSTFALHSASAQMYNRASWYPSIGFSKTFFLDTPLKNVSKCYSFPGFCDIDLLEPVGDILKNNEKIFFYWMTLNSHIPYDSRDLKNKNKNLCDNLNISSTDRCVHFQLIKEFLDGVSEKFGKKEFKGLEIILVGDHPPPFIKRSIREYFLPEKGVPYLHLQVH